MDLLTVAATSVAGYVPVAQPGGFPFTLTFGQAINLFGAPTLAVLYLPAVLDDLVRWATARR